MTINYGHGHRRATEILMRWDPRGDDEFHELRCCIAAALDEAEVRGAAKEWEAIADDVDHAYTNDYVYSSADIRARGTREACQACGATDRLGTDAGESTATCWPHCVRGQRP